MTTAHDMPMSGTCCKILPAMEQLDRDILTATSLPNRTA